MEDSKEMTFPGTICTAEEWNEKHPVGTKVRIYDGFAGTGDVVDTVTVSEAWSIGMSETLGRETVLVMIKFRDKELGWNVSFLKVVE